ncbi:S8 family serine peptidase [Flavobacterium pectinovorum]|uniref:Choice-of-anchor D domain-containing protein n=1 Tax=Flavobacterium pectinovorum TaxID=29533 RepID=A0A502E5V3_9FLAO|nr:S8 family serine peptidase [Flavobacterium pectinovorum]TPG31851.1 choice-of-anchor D domain-containing protein [Flavobacterium pectinovorum]
MTNYYKKGNRLLSVLIFSLWSFFSFGQQATFKEGVKQGSVKIKFSGQMSQTLKKMNVTTGKRLTTGIQAFDQVSAKVGAKKMHRLFPENSNPRLEAKLRKHKLDLWYVVDIDANQSAKDAVQKYKGIAEVEIAETEKEKVLSDYKFTIIKTPKASKATSAAASYFNDPSLPDQWHYNNTGQTGYPNGSDINLFKAWDIVKGNPQVIVSIHDQGVDVEHPDLKANIWTNTAEFNGVAGVDDDGNGYIDDIHGWNFDKKSGAIDPQPHATHVAGTIAAVNNNGIGVCGVAGGSGNNDGSKVMSMQCLGGGGFEQSYIYAADNGAVISQNSWGYTSPGDFDESVKEAIDYFIAEAGDYPNSPMKGGIVIFAAGNSNSDADWYPGHYENTLSVSSIGPNWEKASYSNYGTWVDIAAPGGETDLGAKNGILSTLPKNQYGYYQGTSMACPHVSGIAALALANRKSQLTPEVLKTKLLTGVVDIDSHNPGYEGKLGSGHIDTFLAIQNNEGKAPNTITDLALTGIAQEFANLSWTVPVDVDDSQPVDFRIYYSTSPITKSNLASAKYDIIKSSALAGTTVTHSISGLLGLTTYYFTVISGDRWNNLSELSNIVQGTTNEGPKITVDDNSKDIVINVDASTSFKGTHDMTILNNGEGVLRWEFLARHKETSLSYFGKKVKYPSAKKTKVASAGKVGRKKSKIAASSKTAAVEPFQFTPQEKSYVDGVTDIIGDNDTAIPNSAATKYVVNEAEGFNLTQIQSYLKIDPQFGPVVVEIYKGTALNKENLIYAQEYNPGSASEGYVSITLDEQLYFQQGETFWVVMHIPAGNLYPLGIGYENTPEGSDNCFISFDLGQTWGPLGVALDSNDFAWFNIASSQNKYLGEYLTLDPVNGEVNGNANEKTILSADGSTLINGTYHANAILKSNDATKTELKVPVTVNVSGQQAVLKSIEKLDFSSVFKGTSKELEFVVKNTGLGNFNDIATNISNPNFELVSSAPNQITADNEILLRVKYTPNATGNDNGVLSLTSASSPKTLKVILFGVSSEPAKIVVDPMTQLIDNVSLGDQVTASVTVKNEGQAALKYFIPKYDQSGTIDTWEGEYHKYGYKYRTSNASEISPLTYQFQDISGTGTDITKYFKAESNRYFPVEMGFDFPYYNEKMKTLYISYQGFTTFDDTSSPINSPSLNGAPYTPKGYISPLGTFIELAAGGSIQYKVEEDKVIVQFTNLGDGFAAAMTAQMVLFADGNIRFYYDKISNDNLPYLNVLIEDYAQNDGILINNYNKLEQINSGMALGFDYPGPDMITSISNAGGILLPGESAKLDVVMETSALHEGMINRYLNIISTDPLNTQVNPLIQINITSGGKAELVVSHTDIDFGDVFQGAIASRKFSIKNNGTAPVTLTGFALDNNKFQITGETSATIAPGLSKVYEIVMPTDVVANFTDVLRIADNKGGSYVMTLSGKVLDPPGITVTNLDLITETLQHGETSKHPLLIENTGKADLEVVATGTNWLTMSEPVGGLDVIPNFTYSYETSNDGTNYQWIDIRKTGTQLPFPDDMFDTDQYWNKITLPWSINFYGKDYTDIQVGNTGVLTFDKPEASAALNDRIPTDSFKTLIAPYWTFGGFNTIDYAKEDVGVFYYSDADKFIISWEYLVNNFGMGDPTSAQVIFYKNGTMKFQYKVNGTVDNNTNVTSIGLQNGDHSDFVAISNFANVNHGSGLAYIINPAEKHVIPAGTTLSAQVNIDARNIYAGQYDGKLMLRTNVPNKELLEKPINLTVTGAPIISSNVAEINYGEIMVNPAASYTQEFLIQNSGAETLQLSNISIESGSAEYTIETYAFFPGWDGGGYWSWANINDLAGVYPPILPGENSKFRITYAPTAASSVSDHIVVESNATVAKMMIPIKAEVTLPPVLTVQTKDVYSVVNYLTDTDTQYAVFDNSKGGGSMKYELSIDYLRKSVSGLSSGTGKVAKVAKTSNVRNLLRSMPASKGGYAAYADPSFNRVLAHEQKNTPDTHFGYDGGEPFTTATRFNAGKDGFTLSHFQTYMYGSAKPSGSIAYEIRAGGSSAAEATIIEQGYVDYVYEGDKNGAWVTLPIKEPKGLYPNEDFYIVITYPYELPFVQGAYGGIADTPGRYTLTDGEEWYDLQDSGLYPGYGWMVRAGEENYASNAWVSINGLSNGDVAPGKTNKVQLDFTAANGVRGDQLAVLNIRTNDPVNTVGQVPVKMHINEAPVFSKLPEEVTIVNEAAEVIVNLGLTDKEGNKITVQSQDLPTWVSFEVTGDQMAVKLAPGYETAGTYTLTFKAVDEYGAAREITMEVKVVKTNRAPVVIKSDELIYSKLNFFDVRQFGDYFSDPDGDKMTFNASSANDNIVSITVGQELGQYVIETHAVGETIVTLTATDIFGLSTDQQITVKVVNNHAPVALGGQAIVFNKLSVQEAFSFDKYFSDADGDELTYQAVIADPKIASVTASTDGFTVESFSNGETELILTATDIYGATAEQRITVIVNQSEVTELNIFPNPVINTVNIKWTSRWAGDVVVEVVALNGSIMRTFNIDDVQLKTSSQLDLSTLPAGAYFLHVSGKEGTSSVFKFIKRSGE